MALTKADIIEIQESAKFNHMKRLREQEEKKQFAVQLQEKIAQETKKTVNVDKKGK